MRFKLVFKTAESQVIPFNYQYELAAGLYRIFASVKNLCPRYSSMALKDFLNQCTFSRIEIPKRAITPGGIQCLSSRVFLKISLGFPDIGSEILSRAFAIHKNQLQIVKKGKNGETLSTRLSLEGLDFLPCPDFSSPMKLKMLSPLVLTAKDSSKRFLSIHENDAIARALKESLREKFSMLYSHAAPDAPLSIRFDEGYCAGKSEKDLYSLIRMKEGAKDSFSILGILAPFEIKTLPELIQLGYYSGFGEKSSMGFGMAEAITENKKASPAPTKDELKAPLPIESDDDAL